MTLPPFYNPTVVITRPYDASLRFVDSLSHAAGRFQPLICPAFDVVQISANVPAFDVAVFTSRAGVENAPTGQHRVAYCVGNATAQAANEMGYTAVSSNGSAADLCQLILRDNPQGKLLHIRGEVSHGNVMQVLVHGGLECHEVVVYTKQPRCPDVSVRNMISSLQYFILPIFSTETVSIIASWGINLNAAHVVAISELVASEAGIFVPASIVVSRTPDLPSMVAGTTCLIA